MRIADMGMRPLNQLLTIIMKNIAIILLLMLLQGCIQYNYATRFTPETTMFDVRSPDMKSDDWQFFTTLFDEGGLHLEIHHLWRQYSDDGLNDYQQIHIEYSELKNSEYKLLLDTISVSVVDMDGNFINEIKPASINDISGFKYYYPLGLPKKLIEVVNFKVEKDGSVKEVSKRMLVKRKLNYTIWAVMMSI